MTFLAPLLLLGLLLVPVLIGLYLWAQRRRGRYAVRFTNLDLLANIAPKRPSWRRHLPPVIYLGAVALLVFGLARPSMVVAVPREDATVLLAIDVSGSMKATDVSPTRLDAARDAARSFVGQLPEGIRVGVVAFASRPVTLVSPTDDRGTVIDAIDRLEPLDGTAMGDALMQVLDIAEDIQAPMPLPPRRIRPALPTRRPIRPHLPTWPTTSPTMDPSSRRSSSRTAPTRSVWPSRSTPRSVPPRWAFRSTPSPSGPPMARSRSRISSART